MSTQLEHMQKRRREVLEKKTLLPKHREVLRLVVLGRSDREIAEHVGITTVSVRNIRVSEQGKRLIAILQQSRDESTMDVQKRIHDLSKDAMGVLESAVRQDGECLLDPKDRAKLALQVLDRAGHSPVKRSEVRTTGAIASYHLLANLDQRAEEEENVMEVSSGG